jgi:D-2-hydroxyacid dehydrogenase (NADP+)
MSSPKSTQGHSLLMILQVPDGIRHQYESGIRQAFPDLDLHVVADPTQADPYLANTTVIVTHGPYLGASAGHIYSNAPNLQWVQGIGVGVDNIADHPSLHTDVMVTNIHGTQGIPMTELALSLMLSLARKLPRSFQNKLDHRWERWPSKLLNGKTIGIVGVGSIAETLAPACKALGMHVVGIGSRLEVPNFDRMRPRTELLSTVAEFDYLLLLVPYSPDTHHIIDRDVIKAMKPDAFLINIARGGVLDEDALLEALRERRIAGAALDVFMTEPLGSEHAFWDLDNLIITCHQGVVHEDVARINVPIICDNLRSFLANDWQAMRHVIRTGNKPFKPSSQVE